MTSEREQAQLLPPGLHDSAKLLTVVFSRRQQCRRDPCLRMGRPGLSHDALMLAESLQ